MRPVIFFLSWFLITMCYALKVITIESPVINTAPYLESNPPQQEKDINPTDSEEFPLPVKSHIQAGTLSTHHIKHNGFSQVIFVVGDDSLSRDWLKTHASKLRKLKAVGLVTNVKNFQSLRELVKLAGAPLQPVNVDELATMLKVNHYPFVYDEGVLWQ